MSTDIRRTGIEVIGDVPWATHFCQFYETKQDLTDILVPYFRSGLENNEFCVWVTSEDLSTDEAIEALQRSIPGFDSYRLAGQIEVFPYDTWYLKGGEFDQERVLGGWVGKLELGLSRGFDGIRISGNTCWLESSNWADFAVYEKAINDVIGDYKMLVLCTYSLNRCGATEIAEVVGNHQFALMRRGGSWETIETSEYKQTKEILRRERDFTSAVLETAGCLVTVLDQRGRIVRFNRACEMISGYSFEEVRGRDFRDFLLVPEELAGTSSVLAELQSGPAANSHENYWVARNGERRLISWSNTSMTSPDGEVEYIIATGIDITERKKAEDALRHQVYVLQRALLPSDKPEISGYTVASAYHPAYEGQDIGGDFYDVITTRHGRIGIMIGDVSGKGIPAAAQAASTRSTIAAFVHDSSSPADALTLANSMLVSRSTGDGQFVTAFVAVLDPDTGTVLYSSAGHPPAIVAGRDGRAEVLRPGGMPLGVVESQTYAPAEVRLLPSDRLVLFTDGVTEARHGRDLFGVEGICDVLARNARASNAELVDRLLGAATDWANGKLRDDTAIVVVGRDP